MIKSLANAALNELYFEDTRAAKVPSKHEHAKPTMMLPRSANFKRNSPCPCGSGKKFKVCCSVKMQSLPIIEEKKNESSSELPN